MLPPVLEIYVVWHPNDGRGAALCDEFIRHFHGTIYSGLIGGAVEVYARTTGWRGMDDAPRPIYLSASSPPPSGQSAQFLAVVPILGNELAAAVQQSGSAWREYLQALVTSQRAEPNRIGIFPYRLDENATNGTVLGELTTGQYQGIAAGPIGGGADGKSTRCRDLTQGIAQLLSPNSGERLTAFISHTKRNSPGEAENVEALIKLVREVIQSTRLQEFFDASDLQPGQDWDAELRGRAATSALLALRTDLYPSREWCQREMLIAKREGMPIIIVDALGDAEERGSFLMDHVPRVPARMEGGGWRSSDIHRALNLLVDECLKRALWRRQAELASRDSIVPVSWWAPHAPEPLTLTSWLQTERQAGRFTANNANVVILHPDPPLGTDEKLVLKEMLNLAGINGEFDVMTPRLLAARGG